MSGDVPTPPDPSQPLSGSEDSWKKHSSAVYGGPLRRFFARTIDGMIFAVPVGVVAWALGLDPGGAAFNVLFTVGHFAYFVYFETSRGQTPAKSLLRLRVADQNDRSPVEPVRSIRRNAWMLIGIIAVTSSLYVIAATLLVLVQIVIWATIRADMYNQGLHDKIANTTVPRSA